MPSKKKICYLLTLITLLILGYFLYKSADSGSGIRRLSDAEKKLLENIRTVSSPEKVDAFANAPEYFYRSILDSIPEPESSEPSPFQRLLAEIHSTHPNLNELSGLVRHIEAEKIEPAIKTMLQSTDPEVTELAVWLAIKLTRTKPERALTLAAYFPSEKARGHITVNGVWQWAQKNPYEAFEWLSNQLDTVGSSTNYVFLEMAKDNQKEALRHLGMISSRDTMQRGRRGIIRALAESEQPNAETIVDFIMAQPEHSRSNLVYNLFRNYLETNALETVEPLAEALAGRDYELGQKAYLAFVSEYAEEHPKAAVEWSLQIPHPDYRARTLERAIKQWAKNDLEAAAQWLKERPKEAVYEHGRSALAREIAKTLR